MSAFDWSLFPDWEKAKQHAAAVRVGRAKRETDESSPESRRICYCCLNYIQKEPVRLCENSERLDFIGNGFPLYFAFMKYTMGLCLILIGSYSIIALQLAIINNFDLCQNQQDAVSSSSQNASVLNVQCTTFMIYFGRIQTEITNTEGILRIVGYVMQLLALFYMRTRIRNHDLFLRNRNRSLADYSILVKNVPKHQNLKSNLKRFFRQAFPRPYEIYLVTFIPQIKHYYQFQGHMTEITRKKVKVLRQLQKLYARQQGSMMKNIHREAKIDNIAQSSWNRNKQKFSKTMTEVLELQHQLIALETESDGLIEGLHQQFVNYNEQMKNDTIKSEWVILTFVNESTRKQIEQEFKKLDKSKFRNYLGLGASKIVFSEAPQPQQILWDNLHISSKQKLCRFLINVAVTVIVLAVVTTIYFFVLRAKTQDVLYYVRQFDGSSSDEGDFLLKRAIAIVYIMLILLVNFNKAILGILAQVLAKFQKPETVAGYELIICVFYTFTTFFTIAIVVLFAETVTENYAGNYGLLEQQTLLVVLGAALTPLAWIIHPYWLLRWAIRKYFYKSEFVTQRDANWFMEEPVYEVGRRYGQIIHLIWLAFFYVTLIPFGSMVVLASLFFSYFIDKFNLLKRSSLMGKLSSTLVNPMLRLLEFTLVLRPAGELIFDTQIRGSFLASSIVFLVIGVVYMVIPWQVILDYVYDDQMIRDDIDFNQIRYQTSATYHTYHPVYRELHLMDHLHKRKLIPNYQRWKSSKKVVARFSGQYGVSQGRLIMGAVDAPSKSAKESASQV